MIIEIQVQKNALLFDIQVLHVITFGKLAHAMYRDFFSAVKNENSIGKCLIYFFLSLLKKK